MKKYKLHQWLPLFLALVIFTSCSQKGFPENNSEVQHDFKNTDNTSDGYTPPQVISVSDELAKSTKEGEMYYDNEYGYRYWRLGDGKYYLDSKYNSGIKPSKKLARKYHKKKVENDYTHG